MDTLKLRSSISPKLLRSYLIKGTIIAAFGSTILFFSFGFLALNALFLICAGLYPYKKLKSLETAPHEIICMDNDHFLFAWKRKPVFSLAYKCIEKMIFMEDKSQYGIGILLKKPIKDSVKLVNPYFDMQKFQKSCQKKQGYDLFLPYFSKHAFAKLSNFLEK